VYINQVQNIKWTVEIMEKLKLFIKTLSSFVLTNERINSQTCVAKDIDTSKTILDHKETSK